MLEFFVIVILIQFKSSYAPEAYEDVNEALEKQFKDSTELGYVCPADSENAKKLLKISKQHYELRYCLFDKKFDAYHDKLCQSEVKPIFVAYKDKKSKKPVPCGSGKNQFLHYFGYYYCGRPDKLDELLAIKKSEEVKHIPMYLYDVCFDVSKQKTIWTNHAIVKPSIFLNPSFEELSYEDEISSEPFFLNPKHFLKTKQRYEAEVNRRIESRFKMVPQPMVPVEHFAKRIWKKATNHYINMAPYSKGMLTLMKAINEGIRTAALVISRRKFENESEKQQLVIYTAVKGLHKPGWISRIFKSDPTKSFKANIWYKFVYNSVTKQGIMIYLHNEYEKMSNRLCPEKNEIYCYFTEWVTSMKWMEAWNGIDSQYAYCCKVTSKETEEIFSKSFDIQEVLDIQALIEKRDW